MAERQLNMFKGRRQKGELLAPPTELALHIPLVAHIKRCIRPGWSFTHPASGEHRDKRTAAKLKAMGVTPGFPDLMFFGPEETVFFLELKRFGETLNDAQKDVRFRLMRSGFDYLFTDDMQDALLQLSDRGIIARTTVSA